MPVSMKERVSVDRWVSAFGGRLLGELGAEPCSRLAAQLHAEHDALTDSQAPELAALRGRQRLVSFITLRVSLSFSTYAVRSTIPNDLQRLLLSHRGNCSDQAVRLMMALDSVGIESVLVPVHTPGIPGHMIVDAYDPQDGAAYLLDSQFNMVARMPLAGQGFLTRWLALEAPTRRSWLRDGRVAVTALPCHIRYCDPGPPGLRATTITAESLNQHGTAQRLETWHNFLLQEMGDLVDGWRRGFPGQAPRNLTQLGTAFGINGLLDFRPRTAGDAAPLWQAAGLAAGDPAAFQWSNELPLED